MGTCYKVLGVSYGIHLIKYEEDYKEGYSQYDLRQNGLFGRNKYFLQFYMVIKSKYHLEIQKNVIIPKKLE